MSEENVEVVRGAFDAFNRRDRGAFRGRCDPAAEWHVTGLVVDQQHVYRQAGAIWQYLLSFADEFTEFRADFEDFIEAGEKVVVVVRLHGRGRTSRGDSRPSLRGALSRSVTEKCCGRKTTPRLRKPSKPLRCRSRRSLAGRPRYHAGYQTERTGANSAELRAPQRTQIASIRLSYAISHPGGRRFEPG